MRASDRQAEHRGARRRIAVGVAAGAAAVALSGLLATPGGAVGEQPCDFLPLGVEGATLDVQGPDTHAECVADLLVGRRTAEGDEFVGVFIVSITHESWGDIEGVYRQLAEGGSPIDLGDEGVFATTENRAGLPFYGAYFLKGPYSVSVEHQTMDPDFFAEDTARTRALTETLARAIDSMMDDAGIDAGVGAGSSGGPEGGVTPPSGSGGVTSPASSDDGGNVPLGPIVGTTVVVVAGTAVVINVLRRRPPTRTGRPGEPGDVPRCWEEVSALDDATTRLEGERDDLRRARDDAYGRIERIERALEAEATLDDAFRGYADAILRTQQVHTAKVYGDTAIVVSAIFAAGAASIEALNAFFGVEAAAMSPEALALSNQVQQGVQATRTAAQAAARLPELQAQLLNAKRLADVAKTAELATAASQQVAATEQAIATAHSAIRAGAAAADAAPGLAAQLSRLTSVSLPAQLWARFKGVGTMIVEMAGSNAVSASRAAESALGRLAPEQQERLFDEIMRAADAHRDLSARAREMAVEMRRELETLRSDMATAERLVGEAERKIDEVAARRATKVAECEQLVARVAAAATTGG
ncbi:MAG: hypothetical protein M5U14_20165 [Acidimicrobiia bacterium]|nr:hypothetical protein [Acidimicrobiia bacterium]